MAYKDVTNGYLVDTANQSNLPWAQTFRMTVRVPAIANRIFDTKQHALDFVQDSTTTASAIVGLILSVFADETFGNNGLWYVKSTGVDGELVQVFDADNGKAVIEDNELVTKAQLDTAVAELNAAISGNTTLIENLSSTVSTLDTTLTNHITTFETFTGATNTAIESINTTLSGHTSSITELEKKFSGIGTLFKLRGTVTNLETFEEWLIKNNEKLTDESTEMGDVPVFEDGNVFIDSTTNDEYLILSNETGFTYEVLGPVINIDSIDDTFINNLFTSA